MKKEARKREVGSARKNSAARTRKSSATPDASRKTDSAAVKNDRADFAAAFAGLKAVLAPHMGRLKATADTAGKYEVSTLASRPGTSAWCAAVHIQKNYVSFYLMPLYMYPELGKSISAALAKRRQGKSCFNFTGPDPELFRELAVLTDAGFREFRTRHLP
jgi:hypothetical protein